MKTKYIHIGLPKNLSTTLQRDFFDQHPEIYHLGVGVGSNVDYINSVIGAACENHFQYSKKFTYRKAKEGIHQAFQNEFGLFQQNPEKKACGISLELLSFTFTPDQIEIEEKAQRVFEAFGKDTKIILIVRQQKNLIESLYKEAIKIGYYGTFQDYLEYIYYKRDNNFIFDFQYHYLYELYSNLFGKDNMEVLCIEDYRTSEGKLRYREDTCLLTEKLCQVLNITPLNLNLDHYNKPLSLSALEKMRNLNKEFVHGIGNQAYSTGTNFHRLKDHFRGDLGISIEDDVLYRDARMKNRNIEKAEADYEKVREIEFSYPNYIERFLKELFETSNRRLEQQLGRALPSSYFEF